MEKVFSKLLTYGEKVVSFETYFCVDDGDALSGAKDANNIKMCLQKGVFSFGSCDC